jgi:hypothetical protein
VIKTQKKPACNWKEEYIDFNYYSMPVLGDMITAFNAANYGGKRKAIAAFLACSRIAYVAACGLVGGPIAALAANEFVALSEDMTTHYSMKHIKDKSQPEKKNIIDMKRGRGGVYEQV